MKKVALRPYPTGLMWYFSEINCLEEPQKFW